MGSRTMQRVRGDDRERGFGLTMAFAVFATLVPACASVIGADDYKVGTVDGGTDGGNTGGHVGTGGGPGTGGSGDGGGDSGGGAPTSGATLCESTCSDGLLCEHSSLGASGICAVRCVTLDDCDAEHDCIGGTSVGFEYSCVLKCPEGTCPSGFTCASVGAADDAGTLSDCLPSDWLTSDDAGPTEAGSGLPGTGDGCLLDADCASGLCASNGSDRAWCTKLCTTSSDCVGSHAGANEFGSTNGCLGAASNQNLCFPECDLDPNICANFPRTGCYPGFQIDGITHSICTLPPSSSDAGSN